MRIQLTNKHYDCTVLDCINKFAGLVGNTHYIFVRSGRTIYDQVGITRGGDKARLRVAREVRDRVSRTWRYFELNTPVELIPIGSEVLDKLPTA